LIRPLYRSGINLFMFGNVRRRYSTPVGADPLDSVEVIAEVWMS
jgi:hypothetical protein